MEIISNSFKAKVYHLSHSGDEVISDISFVICRVERISDFTGWTSRVLIKTKYTIIPQEPPVFKTRDSYIKYVSRNYLLNSDINTTYSPNFKRSPIRWVKTLLSKLKLLVQYFYDKF